jgi:hypothetical protein
MCIGQHCTTRTSNIALPGPHRAGQVLELTHMNDTWRQQDQRWTHAVIAQPVLVSTVSHSCWTQAWQDLARSGGSAATGASTARKSCQALTRYPSKATQQQIDAELHAATIDHCNCYRRQKQSHECSTAVTSSHCGRVVEIRLNVNMCLAW